MNGTPYLICELHGLHYAVDARVVREMFALPELRPLGDVPDCFVGALNVRGAIVPVLDLDVRSGRVPAPYAAADVVVVLGLADTLLGLIVNDVADVVELTPEAMEPIPPIGGVDPQRRFVARLAKVATDIVMVLDHEKLIPEAEAALASRDGSPEPLAAAHGTGGNGSGPAPAGEGNTGAALAAGTGGGDRALFAERARRLVAATKGRDIRTLTPVGAFVLAGEYYGVELDLIQEFSQIQAITPLPCCPPHIVGQVNLRGDVVTLVDIGPTLNLPPAGAGEREKMMVVRVDSVRMGIPVDDVSDVVYVHADDVADVPAALRPAGREYLRGAVPFAGRMLGLLDLRGMVRDRAFAVREEV